MFYLLPKGYIYSHVIIMLRYTAWGIEGEYFPTTENDGENRQNFQISLYMNNLTFMDCYASFLYSISLVFPFLAPYKTHRQALIFLCSLLLQKFI